MNAPILHHYANSPFSEKIRLILGAKGLAWQSVFIPPVMPKPDVIALTGGYRRTPILQIGADVYCDTALIARVLDALHPEPPLYPAEIAGTAQMLAQWADATLFWAVIPYTMQPAGAAVILGGDPAVMKAFAADRAPFSAGITRQTPADATAALCTYLGWLETHVGEGRDFLVRGTLSIADFSVAHCLWFTQLAPPVAGILGEFPQLSAWYERMRAFGHGRPSRLGSGEALAIAAAAAGHAPVAVQPGQGFDAGDAVTVTPTDYGRDPSAGVLVGLDGQSVVIERRDERAGVVHVHFPRLGFQIRKEPSA